MGVERKEAESQAFRRSLFVVKDMQGWRRIHTAQTVRSIRPGAGLHTRFLTRC